MSKMNRTLPLVLAAALAGYMSSACSVSNSSALPPNLDRSASVKGPDANNNGVRDDIDAFIQKNYTGEAQRRAATQYAAAMQQVLLVDKSDPIAVQAVSVLGTRATSCLFNKFKVNDDLTAFSQTRRELVDITKNTKQRRLAAIAFDKAMDGSVIFSATGDTCE
jgi:hypothetical protein